MRKNFKLISILLAVVLSFGVFFGVLAFNDGLNGDFFNFGNGQNVEYEGISENEYLENSVLTATLGEPVGMQGFVGDYALRDDPNEIVEIIVQFRTPPAVALRLMQENFAEQDSQDISFNERELSEVSFEAYALSAHDIFRAQLGTLAGISSTEVFENIMPVSRIEIFCETHNLFNGVHMRVSSGMVEQIARLPEVFMVTPHIIVEPERQIAEEYIETNEVLDFNMTAYPSPLSSFFINNNLFRTTRNLFNIDNIHSVLGITGNGVRVAFLDTGVDHTHPEFANHTDPNDPQGRIRGWQQHVERGFVHTDTTIPAFHGHGTSTAGAIIAMAPEVELWSFRRWSGAGEPPSFTPIGALEIAHGLEMDIIYTWGGGTNPFDQINNAVTLAVLDGIVVVVAVHNDGPGASTVLSPSLSPLAISVGAGTAGNDTHIFNGWGTPILTDNVATFSGRGPVLETFHIKPDIIAPGQSGISTHDTTLGGNHYRLFSGTSQATPLITGVAALLVQQFPEAQPYEIKARIMNTARPLAGANQNGVFMAGAGFAQPHNALTTQTIVTAIHPVSINFNANPNRPIFLPTLTNNRHEPFVDKPMASLSFGSVDPQNNIIPIRITNTRNVPQTYTITRAFTANTNTNNAANLTFRLNNVASAGSNSLNVTVPANSTLQIYAVMTFTANAPFGFYEGVMTVTGGGNTARLPFAANLTERATNPITTFARNVNFNGTNFTLGTIDLTAASNLQTNRVFVVIYRHTPTEFQRWTPPGQPTVINAGATIPITPGAAVNTFGRDDHIEIRVYRVGSNATQGVRQHLLSRQVVHPVLFEF